MPDQNWGVITAKNSSYFLHVLNPPANREILLPDWKYQIASVTDIEHTGAIIYKHTDKGLVVTLPDSLPLNSMDYIIEIKLNASKK